MTKFQKFQVGDTVRAVKGTEVGTIVRIRQGVATRKLIYSVDYTKGRKNPGHGFYYEDEIVKVEEG